MRRDRLQPGAQLGSYRILVTELLAGAYNQQAIGLCVWALGVVGQTDDSHRLLKTLEHPPPGLWVDRTVMGTAYGGVGDIDRAIAWGRKGMEERARTCCT